MFFFFKQIKSYFLSLASSENSTPNENETKKSNNEKMQGNSRVFIIFFIIFVCNTAQRSI